MADAATQEKRVLQAMSITATLGAVATVMFVAWQIALLGERLSMIYRGKSDALPLFTRMIAHLPSFLLWLIALTLAAACVAVHFRPWARITCTCFSLLVLVFSLAAYHFANVAATSTLFRLTALMQ